MGYLLLSQNEAFTSHGPQYWTNPSLRIALSVGLLFGPLVCLPPKSTTSRPERPYSAKDENKRLLVFINIYIYKHIRPNIHSSQARSKRSPTIGLNIANLLRVAAFPFVFLPTNFIGLQVSYLKHQIRNQCGISFTRKSTLINHSTIKCLWRNKILSETHYFDNWLHVQHHQVTLPRPKFPGQSK